MGFVKTFSSAMVALFSPVLYADILCLYKAHRVLKPNGKFLWVGFRQPLQMQYIWNLDELWKIEKRENMGEPGGLSYYGWVFSKVTTKSDGKSESPVSQA
jgi:ubiquinone/menaquinone biosynthesis C-methylase UbiE